MEELDLLHDPDDAQTAPMMAVPRESLETGGPLPGPMNGPREVAPGAHRQDGPTRPWGWLIAVLAAALLAVGGLVWMIGATVGRGDRTAAPAVAASPSATLSLEPSPTMPVDTATQAIPTPSATTPQLSVSPAPTVTAVVTPTPKPSAVGGFVVVPNVVGDRVRSATRELERLGLKVSVMPVGGQNAAQRVIAQQPSGGRVPRGSTVVLLAGVGGGG